MITPTLSKAATPAPAGTAAHANRFAVLDGWRGISILSVLACHLLPLGPKSLGLNEMAGPFGMALFFALSGFLITSTLLKDGNVGAFFIRRFCRIIPLAYVVAAIALLLQRKSAPFYAAHFLFTINYQATLMTDATGHFWSLCVEVHFYLLAGLVALCFGKKGLWAFPALALLVTANRILTGAHISIESHLRGDEILAGAILGLAHHSAVLETLRKGVARINILIWLALLLLAAHPDAGAMNYLRPYAAAALVGCSLWQRGPLHRMLESRPLEYFARTSYALYLIHPVAEMGWLGTGGTIIKYALKRPITIALTFILAHLSTHYFENRWIDFGKRWASRITKASPPAAARIKSALPATS